MVSLSSVSTLLPPQRPATPLVATAIPTPSAPPVAAPTHTSSGGGSGTSSDHKGGSNAGMTAYNILRSRADNPAVSAAVTASHISKAAEDSQPLGVNAARRYAVLAQQTAPTHAWIKSMALRDTSDETDRPMPKANGPLPLPTADILMYLKSTRMT